MGVKTRIRRDDHRGVGLVVPASRRTHMPPPVRSVGRGPRARRASYRTVGGARSLILPGQVLSGSLSSSRTDGMLWPTVSRELSRRGGMALPSVNRGRSLGVMFLQLPGVEDGMLAFLPGYEAAAR